MPVLPLVHAFARRVLRDDGVLSAVAALALAVVVAALKAFCGVPAT